MKDTGINKNFKRFSINPNPENYLCEQRNSVFITVSDLDVYSEIMFRYCRMDSLGPCYSWKHWVHQKWTGRYLVLLESAGPWRNHRPVFLLET